MPEGLSIVRLAFARTVRLVTTARLRQAALAALAANPEDLDALAEIEGATSARLMAEDRGLDGVAARELVHGVPNANFINAAFTYAKPRELNRFNGPTRGAWYAALEVETALAEVVFHMTGFLELAGDFHATVEYAEMFASLAGEFVDLRTADPTDPRLDPDPARAYPLGNTLADEALARGLNGIVYPSVRYPSGTCVVALRPHAVQSAAAGDVFRVTWSGAREPTIARLPADAA